MTRKARIWFNVESRESEVTKVVEVDRVEKVGKTFEVYLKDSETPDYYVNGVHFLDR